MVALVATAWPADRDGATIFHRPGEVTAGWPFVLSSILSRQVSKSMDGIAAVSVVLGSAAVAVACFFILWLRRRRARSLIRGLFQDYFAESFAAEELGRRVRASVGRRFTGRNEFFAEAVAAFQHAVNARLPPTHTAQVRPSCLDSSPR